MSQTCYYIEMHDGVKWWYDAQTSTLKHAIVIAGRRDAKMRVRKVVKTIVWKGPKK